MAMVVGKRSRERDLSDQDALDRCKEDIHTAITYVLARIEAAAPPGLDEERKHRLTMAQLQGMPIEMLDRSYNLYRMEMLAVLTASTWMSTLNSAPTRPSTKWASPHRATRKWPELSSESCAGSNKNKSQGP